MTVRPRFRNPGARPVVFGILLLSAFSLLNSCRLLLPNDGHLLETPSLADPELTFRTFAVAFRKDEPRVEYRCLSEKFKQKYEITLQTYIHAKARMLQDYPYLTWIGRMSIGPVKIHQGEGTAFVHAYIPLFGPRLVADLEEVSYWRIYFKDGSPYLDAQIASIPSIIRGSGMMWALDFQDPQLRGIRPEEIEHIEIGTEWKITDFRIPVEPE